MMNVGFPRSIGTDLRIMRRTLLSTALLVSLLIGCTEDRETTTPTVSAITESVYASGIVKAEGQYQVVPAVNGTVAALLVREGDTVKVGQPILRIDDRTSAAAARSADAQLRLLEQNVSDNGPVLTQLREAVTQARDKYTLDSTNYARQQALWEQRIGSKGDLDQRELAFNGSKAAYTRARKALEETRNRLRTELDVARNSAAISGAGNDDRTQRSLIDGIVYDLMIEPGELATMQRAIAVIGSATDLYLELEVDEYDITRVEVFKAPATPPVPTGGRWSACRPPGSRNRAQPTAHVRVFHPTVSCPPWLAARQPPPGAPRPNWTTHRHGRSAPPETAGHMRPADSRPRPR